VIEKNKRRFIEFDKDTRDNHQHILNLTKTVLDLIRNIIVIGGLKYVVDKTHSVALTTMFTAGLAALTLEFYIRILPLNVYLFEWVRWKKVRLVLHIALNVVIMLGLFMLAQNGIDDAIAAIKAAQSGK
jgi:hypothetical protein